MFSYIKDSLSVSITSVSCTKWPPDVQFKIQLWKAISLKGNTEQRQSDITLLPQEFLFCVILKSHFNVSSCYSVLLVASLLIYFF